MIRVFFFLLTFFVFLSAQELQQKQPISNLTDREKNYLKDNIITIGMVQGYYPFSYKKNNKVIGFSSEYFKLLASKVNMKYKIEIDHWAQNINKFKNKKIDIIDSISYTKERESFISFTHPYFYIPNVIFTRKNSIQNYKNLHSLQGKKVGITKNIYYFDTMKELNLFELVPFSSAKEKFKALAYEKIDAAFSTLSAGKKFILKDGYSDIEILDEISQNIVQKGDLRLGISKENHILFSIVNKAQSRISDQEKLELLNKYFGTPIKKNKISKIKLTQTEKEFLQQHPTIYLGADESWAPYIIKNKNGTISGYDKEILEQVNAITGANFQLKVGKWDTLVQQAKNKKIDGLSSSTKKHNRANYFKFSSAYMKSSQVLIVSNQNPKKIFTVKDLKGKTIAIQKDNAYEKQVVKNIKNIKIIYTQDIKESLSYVIKGLADATLANETMNYYVSHDYLSFVKIVDIIKNKKTDIVFSIRDDWPEAVSILNKGLQNIGIKKQSEIKNKWFISPNQNNRVELNLTNKEIDYLNRKGSIKMCIDPDWEPYEKIDKNNNHVGLVADFIQLIEKKINKEIKLVPTKTWHQSLEYVQLGKCEILSFLNKTQERSKYLEFTPILYAEPEVIIAKDDVPYLNSISSLRGKKVGVVKGYSEDEYISNNFPDIEIKYIKNHEEGLKQISSGEIYATVNSLLGIADLIRKENLVDIKIAGETELNNNYRIGITKEDKLLHSILSKAVELITPIEKDKILANWVSVKFEQNFGYTKFWQGFALFTSIILIIIYWNLKLKKLNKQLEIEKEKAQNATKAKTRFLANMSHEIRTPINGIMGINYLLSKTDLNEKQTEYTKKLHSSTEHLLNIINDILDISKIEAGKIELEKINFKIENLLEDIKNSVDYKAKEKGLELNFIYDKTDTIYYADSVKILQILINLVDNAIKFTHNGQVNIKVKIIDEQTIEFVVSDTGIGLTIQQQTNIFNQFSQADNTITRKYGGTGLGLSISKQLANLMGGDLSVQSNLGKGSTFTFICKVENAKEDFVETDSFESFKNLKLIKNDIRILLVEDNQINQDIVIEILNDIKVDVADNGLAAIKKFEKNTYHLILMDIQMPIMDGFSAAKKIRELNKKIPIIALSANITPSTIYEIINVGMNDYISKPINLQKLYTKLNKYLQVENRSHKENHDTSIINSNYEHINISKALTLINNNKELLNSIFESFLNKYKDFNILNSQDIDKDSHSLNGLILNIGGEKLYSLSQEYTNTKSLNTLKDIQSELNNVLNEIKNYLDLQVINPSKQEKLSNKQIDQLFLDLKQSAKDSLPLECKNSIQKLKNSVLNTTQQQLLIELENALKEYKFKQIIQLINNEIK